MTASQVPDTSTTLLRDVVDLRCARLEDADSSEVDLVTETMAEAVHETWMRGRLSDGWRLGRVRDDDKKQHPCLVRYSELPESEKDYDRATARQVIIFLKSQGYHVVRRGVDHE